MESASVLATGAPAGERERAFALFVAEHRERAQRLAWRLLGGDAAAAEDVTQDAFARAWRGLAGFRGEAGLGTWFYRILVRQAANHRRWRALRRAWSGPAPEEPADPDPTAPGDPLLRSRIAAALEGLSRPQREAFVLVHLEGWSVREAAAAMGKPLGTTKSHLHRALRALRSQLADLREAPAAAPGQDGRATAAGDPAEREAREQDGRATAAGEPAEREAREQDGRATAAGEPAEREARETGDAT